MTTTDKNRQKGVALVLGLILLLLITAIAFGVIGMANTENSINTNFKAEETEYFAARAGVEEARNRILTSATNQLGVSTAFGGLLPTNPPDQGGTVLYILNGTKTDGTPVTVNDIDTYSATNAYFDDDLCHDVPGGAGGTKQVPFNVRCNTMLPAGSITTTASVEPYALDYKWVRIMIKENGSAYYSTGATGYQVDSTQSVKYPVCWDESGTPAAEIVTNSAANCGPLPASNPLARPVYLITALAVSPSGTTRRMVQEEVSLGITYNPNYAIYSTSSACPAISFTGNGKTGSFASVAGNESDPPPSASTITGAPVGTQGGISMSGNATIAGIAGETSNPPVCFTPDKMKSPASATTINPEKYRVTQAPNPAPPTTSKTYSSNVTLTPGNLYGNISGSGKAVITLQVPDGQGTAANPAVFIMNSLSLSGQSSLALTPADGAACGGSPYCYVTIILAGNGTGTPLSMTGGSWGNMSGIPATLVFDVTQPTACVAAPCGNIQISGNGGAYAMINAPMDNISISGNGDIFGSLLSYQTTDTGNGTLWYDTNNANTYTQDPYLKLISFREVNY